MVAAHISIELEMPARPLVWQAAEVTTHPRGGYTISVPLEGSFSRIYLGEFSTERLARNELARRQCWSR